MMTDYSSVNFGPLGVQDSAEPSGVPALSNTVQTDVVSRSTPGEVVKSQLSTIISRGSCPHVTGGLNVWDTLPLAVRHRRDSFAGLATVRLYKSVVAAADRLSAYNKYLLPKANGS